MGFSKSTGRETTSISFSFKQNGIAQHDSLTCLDDFINLIVRIFEIDEGVLLFANGMVVGEADKSDVLNSITESPFQQFFAEVMFFVFGFARSFGFEDHLFEEG